MAEYKQPKPKTNGKLPTTRDPFTTEPVRPYVSGDTREWGLILRKDVKKGDTIFEDQALVQWTPLSAHTTRREFDHWLMSITQGGTVLEYLTWKWIYEWAIRQALRDRDRVASQRQQDKRPNDVELSLTGWTVQLLELFGQSQKELSHCPVTPWAISQATVFHDQYVQQCRHLQIPCQSVAEIEMSFRILHWIVYHFQWIHIDALTDSPQSWSVLPVVCRIRPCCDPSALLLFKSVPSQAREIQIGYVVATRDLKRGEEITLSIMPSQMTTCARMARPLGCGCGKGRCASAPRASIPPALSVSTQNEWMKPTQKETANKSESKDFSSLANKSESKDLSSLANESESKDLSSLANESKDISSLANESKDLSSLANKSKDLSSLALWRPRMVSWFRGGPPDEKRDFWMSNLITQLKDPVIQHKTNLIWFMYLRTCRLLILYPLPMLDRLSHIIQDEMKKRAQTREPLADQIDSRLHQFWKEWTTFFPENTITPTLRGSFRPAIRYPYLHRWWNTCMELSQKIGSLVWKNESLLKRWNRA